MALLKLTQPAQLSIIAGKGTVDLDLAKPEDHKIMDLVADTRWSFKAIVYVLSNVTA
jgi:hypothetical protein